MGPPRSSKKRPQTNRAHGRVKEILALRRELMATPGNCRVRCPQRIRGMLRKAISVEDSECYGIRPSADHAAGPFGFSSRE
jgi:hypothetical protein